MSRYLFKASSLVLILNAYILTGCTLAPDFKQPEFDIPDTYKEAQDQVAAENWMPVEFSEGSDRGQWWRIFEDERLNELECEAAEANQSIKAAVARVEQARATTRANAARYLPDLNLGGNALRNQPSNASLQVAGSPPGTKAKAYTLFDANGTLTYEVDLFGRTRDTESAFNYDADAQEATFRSVLLALQADVAQNYFSLRALDAERELLLTTVNVREENVRIMDRKYQEGEAGQQDLTRAQSEFALSQADLIALDRQRAITEHALAVLLGKAPAEFSFSEYPLTGVPPEIPAGLPSSLLERRPDVSAALASMAAANSRIGVARAAFFPTLSLTATGGYESITLVDLFKWSSRTWALGQIAGTALTLPIFDNGRRFAQLDAAHSAYTEAVANFRQQVLVAFKDVEDSLASQRLLKEQANKQNIAAQTANRTTDLIEKRYSVGDVNYFEVVDAHRTSLAAGRAAAQIKGLSFINTVSLIRALGGGWDVNPNTDIVTEELPPLQIEEESPPINTDCAEDLPPKTEAEEVTQPDNT